MSPSSARPGALNTTDTLLLTAVFAGAAGSVVHWAGASITAALSAHPVPEVNPVAGAMAIAQYRGNRSAAWGQPVGPPWLYWTSTASVIAVLVAVVAAGWWASVRNKTSRAQDPRRIHGLASRAEVAKVAGARALIARAAELRPSLAHAQVGELGHRLGSAPGVDCPRQHRGLHGPAGPTSIGQRRAHRHQRHPGRARGGHHHPPPALTT